MKKLAVLIVAIIIVSSAWLLLDSQKASTPSPAQSNNSQSQSAEDKSPKPVATDKVTMINVAFTPSIITVKKGATVTWTNKDAVEHTVTETDNQKGPNGPPLNQDQSYTFTFSQAGTYHYHCSIHSEMTGTVIVSE